MVILREKAKSISDKRWFHIWSIVVTILAILIFIIGSFRPEFYSLVFEIEILFGMWFIFEYVVLFFASSLGPKYVFQPMSILNLLVIISIFTSHNLVYLRALRVLHILRIYSDTKRKNVAIMRYDDVISSMLNLLAFVVIVTGIVYTIEAPVNPNVSNYADALYFTITTISTTGYGDIIPQSAGGKAIVVLIMLLGITLFLRFISVFNSTGKKRVLCPTCTLVVHDEDATHCKNCGTRLPES